MLVAFHTLFVNEAANILHTKNKDVWGERITLTNPSRGVKGIKSNPIKQNGYASGRDAAHYDLGQLVRKMKTL